MKKRSIIILGGDLRQYYMAKSLVKRGFAISYYGILFPWELPQVHRCRNKAEMWKILQEEAYAVVLPVPVTADGEHVRSNSLSDEKILLEEILIHVKKEQEIFAEKLPVQWEQRMMKKGVQITDFSSEYLGVRNEIGLEAEAAIIEAELLSDEAVFGSHSLILGDGKNAGALAERLKSWGSDVTIASEIIPEEFFQNPELQMGRGYNFVFRTISKISLNAEGLNCLEPGTVVIDMADSSEGIDYVYAEKQKILVRFCPVAVGKYMAKTAGEMLADVINEKISE